MVLKLGPIDTEIEIVESPQKASLKLTLPELQEFVKWLTTTNSNHNNSGNNYSKQNGDASPSATTNNGNRSLGLLFNNEFKSVIIAKIANRVLDQKAKVKTLPFQMPQIEKAAEKWLDRPIKEDYWALFVAIIEPPRLGQRVIATGLNKEGQMVILGMVEGFAEDLFTALKKRGLAMNKVKFGLISYDACTPKEFQQFFPKATIGRDWREFIERFEDPEDQEKIKEAMLSPDIDEARIVVSRYKGPKELLNYYNFEREFWRVLRSATYIERISWELRRRIKAGTKGSEKDIETLVIWELLRLQYHWYKIPANSDLLKNMKHIKAQLA